MKLNDIRDNQGARKSRVRVGRGIGSGLGKTALVEQFVNDVSERGAIVLRARCRERELTSYKAIDGLIDYSFA